METTLSWLNGWRLSPLALPMLLPLCDSAAEARQMTDPAIIDRAVAEFTGAAIGTPGGARLASDPRLQLAPCDSPLAVSWHTAARTAVKVECPNAAGWRIFVAITPVAHTAAAAPVIKRGDALVIVVRGRGFSVQQPGEAVEAGAVGDWIDVRTSRKAEPVRARIERPGLVSIPAG
ncbi:flagella basal body P-ring formation protein FlgA [Erythrobacter sp. R86502]|uniref:flagella basal body P-ring formation protein FlgA n=1 Tax=Erythrobacter sp. R86502 TaxID=3093846 RepID=UPI0036D3BA3A